MIPNAANFDFDKNAVVKCFASNSAAGRNFNGCKKINQDVFLAKNYVLGHKNFLIFGVYDGHGKFSHYQFFIFNKFIYLLNQLLRNKLGTHGHFISNFVKNYVINYFTRQDLYSENMFGPYTKIVKFK